VCVCVCVCVSVHVCVRVCVSPFSILNGGPHIKRGGTLGLV